MPLNKDDVTYIAQLARLALSDQEKAQLQHELGNILDHVSTLNTLDTQNIPPTTHVLALKNVWRQDAVVAPMDPEAILSNAPYRDGPYFKVKKVLE